MNLFIILLSEKFGSLITGFLFLAVVLSFFVESGISEDQFFVFPITQTLVIPYNNNNNNKKKTRHTRV